MAECNLSLSYTNGRENEKLVKLNYGSWCPTCHKDVSRRRTHSETGEPYKRKGKELNTFTPKKYSRCREYENMELDYDTKDVRFDCCRIRANLCELPTTYITNNCQMSPPLSNLQKLPNGVIDFDNMKSCDNYKLSDSITISNLHDRNSRTILRHDDYMKNIKPHFNVSILNKPQYAEPNVLQPPQQSVRTPLHLPKLSGAKGSAKISNPNSRVPADTADYKSRISQEYFEINRNSCEVPLYKPPYVEKKVTSKPTNYNEQMNRTDITYDTNTYFNQQSDTNIKDRYTKEVEALRKKLQELKDKRMKENGMVTYSSDNKQEGRICTGDNHTVEICDLNKELGRENKRHKRDGHRNGYKVPVKAKIKVSGTNLKKFHKRQPSVKHSTSSLCVESDSDSDKSDKEEDAEIGKSSETKPEQEKLISATNISNGENAQGDSTIWPLRESLFPNIPPYIRFNSYDIDTPLVLPDGQKYLKWKLSSITPIIVRKTLINSGFRLVRKSNEWIGTWDKHMKSPLFKTLKDTQKLNHFPGTFQIGRKDRLWRNLQRLLLRFGEKEFGFVPQTYILPQDLKLLKQNWEYKNGTGEERWIIKPPASARGVGIKVINKWSQLPKKTSLVVQKYIADPYLINGSKFDLRLYVLVTSFNPLRIFLYPDGLVRFASAKYSEDADDLKDKYMHLTNYSINKLSSQYAANEDANACQGHKWTLSKLWEYLEQRGVDTKYIWKCLQDLVIKTIVSGESAISQLCGENINNRYNCYELFGIDVLLDKRLKPWLLEVNISPSLHSASPLDAHVKGPLVQDLFNIVQFHYPPKISKFRGAPKCYESKIYSTALTKKERNKHVQYVQMESREEYVSTMLDYLTGDDVRHLTQAEDEMVVKGKFERIFPTAQTHKYFCFMEVRYYNRLFDAWESLHEKNRKRGIDLLKSLCAQKIHLKVASQTSIEKVQLINNRHSIKRISSIRSKWRRSLLWKRHVINGYSYKTRFTTLTKLKRRHLRTNKVNNVQNTNLGELNSTQQLQQQTDGLNLTTETDCTKITNLLSEEEANEP